MDDAILYSNMFKGSSLLAFFLTLIVFVVAGFTFSSGLSHLFGRDSMFLKEYNALVKDDANTPEALQNLFTDYLSKIATTSLLSIIEKNSSCHNDAHELGKVIFRRTGKNLNDSFYICGKTCKDGCYHGVFMEAFRPGEIRSEGLEHVTADEIRPEILHICEISSTYQAQDECAHAVGHGLMLNLNDITRALALCGVFTNSGIRYYCSTGVFMQHDMDFGEEIIKSGKTHEPCDLFGDQYAVACYRYKVRRLFFLYSDIKQVAAFCNTLTEKGRLGCFHGLGYAYSGSILHNPVNLGAVCSYAGSEADTLACIDGAMENVSGANREAGKRACLSLEGLGKSYLDFCNSIDGKRDALGRETLPLYTSP